MLIADGDQKFFLFDEQKWCKAKKILESSGLLQTMDYSYQVQLLRKNDDVADVYTLILEKPHNFFVTQSDVLVHNFLPVAIGLTWVFGGEVAVSIGAAIVAGLGIAYTRGKHKNEISIEPFDQYGFGGTPGGPNNDKDKWITVVNNMKEFFNKTKFGREIKDCVEKTNERYQGQSIYRIKKRLPKFGLKKGDRFYLDNLHKDHLEVFHSNGKISTILNLDGTENIQKLFKAAGRTLR